MKWTHKILAGTGQVFIKVNIDGELISKRVRMEDIEGDIDIIRCFICDKAAVYLDSGWPYHIEDNRCQRHFGG